MLAYLASINSPLFSFLTNHRRVRYLTSRSPFPTIGVFSKGICLAAFFSSAVLSVMNPTVLPMSTVYAIGNPTSEDLYIGSRVAGSNRATGHRHELRLNLRDKGPASTKLSLLQQFIVSLGGFSNATWGFLVIEPSLATEFRFINPLFQPNANELFILRYFDQWIIRVQE